MNNIIHKTYAINHNDKQGFDELKDEFKTTGLTITEWKVDKIPDNLIEKRATTACNYLCSDKAISTWVSHVSLWRHIVKNKLDRVLILEDKIVPTKNFSKKLVRYWKELPKDWDIVLLGCGGTCEVESKACSTLTTVFNKDNKKYSKHIIKPSFPIGLYAYIITYKCAKKLINHPAFEQIELNFEYNFAKELMDDEDIKMYAINPALVYPAFDRSTSNTLNLFQILDPLTNSVQLSSQSNLQTFLNTKSFNYRPLGIDVTNMTLLFIIVSLILGFVAGEWIKTYYLILLVAFNIAEITFVKTDKAKLKALGLEFILSVTFFLIGIKLRNPKAKISL